MKTLWTSMMHDGDLEFLQSYYLSETTDERLSPLAPPDRGSPQHHFPGASAEVLRSAWNDLVPGSSLNDCFDSA